MIARRQFLQSAAAFAGAAVFTRKAHAAPTVRVLETKVVSLAPLYHGWPTLTRRKNGQLLLVCSGGRERHVCPFGRVELMVSNDNGQSWGWPRVVIDSDIDDRDAGVLETAKGTLLVTTFTSLAYESTLQAAEKAADAPRHWPGERLKAWRAAHTRLNAEERKAELGQWMIRSTDGGKTWSPRYPSIVNSPHGPIQLSDGRLLYAGKELWTGQKRNGVCESRDDGQTWQWLAEIPTHPDHKADEYHELHAVETKDGRIVVHIRNENKVNSNETVQTESTDGGKTWSVPKSIGVWGLPSHLLRLRDGRILMSYGHRRKPLGNQARISNHGQTWSEPLIISDDGTSGDLGYPSTVEIEDKVFLTVWYEALAASPKAVLRQAKWTLQE